MSFMNGLDEEFAPGWRPEPGDTIQGIVDDLDERDGGYGTYPIVTVRRITGPDGAETLSTDRVAIHCMGTVLAGWVKEKGIKRGDRIALRYNGKKIGKSNQSFHDYSKTLQRAEEVPANLRLAAAPAAAKAGFMAGLDTDNDPF